jgi:hypothetical protein
MTPRTKPKHAPMFEHIGAVLARPPLLLEQLHGPITQGHKVFSILLRPLRGKGPEPFIPVDLACFGCGAKRGARAFSIMSGNIDLTGRLSSSLPCVNSKMFAFCSCDGPRHPGLLVGDPLLAGFLE